MNLAPCFRSAKSLLTKESTESSTADGNDGQEQKNPTAHGNSSHKAGKSKEKIKQEWKEAAAIIYTFFSDDGDCTDVLKGNNIVLSAVPRVLKRDELSEPQIIRCKLKRMSAIKKQLRYRRRNGLRHPDVGRLASVFFFDDVDRKVSGLQTAIAKAALKATMNTVSNNDKADLPKPFAYQPRASH